MAGQDYFKYVSQLMKQSPHYRYPDQVSRDVALLLAEFKDLRISEENVFMDGVVQKLYQLSGTIPVNYKGTRYNIPVRIWLQRDFPSSAPWVYVQPTDNMKISDSSAVDTHGRVSIPYLQNWKYPEANLTNLAYALCVEFGTKPPLYSTLPQLQAYQPNTGQQTIPYPTPKIFTLPATAQSSLGLPQASSGSANNLSTSAQQRQRHDMTRDAPSRFNNYSRSVECGSDAVSNSPTSDTHLSSTEEVDCQLCQGQGSAAAIKYCLVCGLNLCSGCLASHNMFPPNRQHALRDLV